METLPRIKAKKIEKAKNHKSPWVFLECFTDEYYKIMKKLRDDEKFNISQETLLSFCSLCSEIDNGGFIQLIQNQMDEYLFDNSFLEEIKSWGADDFVKIVEEAKVIYNNTKEKFAPKSSQKEFLKLYKTNDFGPLEDKFYEMEDKEAEKIKIYVGRNVEKFAIVV